MVGQAPVTDAARPLERIRPGIQQGQAYDTLVRRFEREAQVNARFALTAYGQLYDFGVNETAVSTT